jgi:hypothetical protein
LNFVLCAFSGGCLERTVTVTSDPPGALVSLNDVEVGRTPVVTAFTYYGDYDVRLRREGCEPVVAHHNINPPVYEWVPLDLLATAVPVSIRTNRTWHFDLIPAPALDEASEKALLERAGAMRSQVSP